MRSDALIRRGGASLATPKFSGQDLEIGRLAEAAGVSAPYYLGKNQTTCKCSAKIIAQDLYGISNRNCDYLF